MSSKPLTAPPAQTRSASPLTFLKPHLNEASLRLRNASLGLLAVFLLTTLLPIPTLWVAWDIVSNEGLDSGGWVWCLCITELTMTTLLTLNILQSLYAIRYPRKPLPPLPSPAKGLAMSPPSAAGKRRLGALSPRTSPQNQRSFSSSTSSSPQSNIYASSPLSTPSRTMHYSSSFNASMASGNSSWPSTPSPMAAYLGKSDGGVGRPFDGNLLSRLTGEDEDD